MSLRARFTALASALVLALLVGVRGVVRAAERQRVEREAERAVATVLLDRFPGPPARRAPGEPPPVLPMEPLPSGADAVLLYAPPGGSAWMHVAHTGAGLPLPEALRLAVPPLPERGPVEREERRAGRVWRVRTELVARPRPPLGPDERPFPAGGRPGEAPPEPRPPRPAPLASLLGMAWVDVTGLQTGLEERLRALDLMLLGTLAAGGALAWLAAGLMLRPIRRAAEAAEAIDRVDQRLPARGSADELGRLVTLLNAMLGRLEAGARRERTFLASASHELRRPLAALTAELELALRGSDAADALRESATLALSDARAMGRLVNDLLDHARMEAGALRLTLAPVALREVVDEALARTRRSLEGAPPVSVGPLPARDIVADRAALVRVLENLVENAATHGGPDVRVTLRVREEPGALVLEVEDDGPGIPAAVLERLFEPFQRGDEARARPGSGLGLSIARALVKAHGGTLEALSPVPGAPSDRPGARLVARLPAAGPTPLEPPPPAPAPRGLSPTSAAPAP